MAVTVSKALQPSDYPRIWQRWNEGESMQRLAREFGVSNAVMHNACSILLDNKDLRQPSFGEFVDDSLPELWQRDPTVGDCREHPEVLEGYK